MTPSWQIRSAPALSDLMTDADWEPFAVSDGRVWLRRRVGAEAGDELSEEEMAKWRLGFEKRERDAA